MTDENKAPTLTPPTEVIKDSTVTELTDAVSTAVGAVVTANDGVLAGEITKDVTDAAIGAVADHIVVPLLNSVLGKTVFTKLGSIGYTILHWVQPENPATIPGGIYLSQATEDGSDSQPTPIAQEFIDNARSIFQALVHDSEEAFAELHDLDLIPHGSEIVGHEMIAIHAQLQKSWA